MAAFLMTFELSYWIRMPMGSRRGDSGWLSSAFIFSLQSVYTIQMNQSQVLDNQEDQKVLAVRLKHANWQVRRRAYEVVHTCLEQCSSVREEFKINSELFTPLKLTALLNNITEQKHPILVLKGLDCVLLIITLNQSSTKYFNQLVSEGLQKFPLLTQQRKQVLQKFMEFLYFFKDDPGITTTLGIKLSLPNQKAVMWVIEVIGALELLPLKKKLQDTARKHPKKDVRELAAEIADELGDYPVEKKEERVPVKPLAKGAVKKDDPRKVGELLEKIHCYEQMPSKDQQKFTVELLQWMDSISGMYMTPQLSNFSYFVQLMIEDNNQIISTNGIKILSELVRNRSQLLPLSFPLLFVFRKFKMHKTHSTNSNLFRLVEVLLCSPRSTDLMAAVLEGMALAENKANIKYGCIMSFIRIFCYFYEQQDLFQQYCIGQYESLGEKIENKKAVEKALGRCAEFFIKEKDRDYLPAIEKVREIISISSYVSSQQKINKLSEQKLNRTAKDPTTNIKSKTQTLGKAFASSKSTKSSSALTLSPEGELNKVLQLTQSTKCSEAALRKCLTACLKSTEKCLSEQVYDMFYYCSILEAFIADYQSNEDWDQTISLFLIDYLKIVAAMPVKQSKKSSKLLLNGIDFLFKISISKLALGKELLVILGSVKNSVGCQVVLKCLGDVLVMEGDTPKKKNKKYLVRWLEQHIPQDLIDNHYFQLREAIERRPQEKQVVEGPPSIIAIPKRSEPNLQQQIRSAGADTFRKKEKETIPRPQAVRYDAEEKNILVNARSEFEGERNQEASFIPFTSLKKPQKLDMLQNADISHIQRVEEQQTDRLDEKWQYFLSKKGIVSSQGQQNVLSSKPQAYQEEQKFQFSHEAHQLQEKDSRINNRYEDKVSPNPAIKYQVDSEEDAHQLTKQERIPSEGMQEYEERQFYKQQPSYQQLEIKHFHQPQEKEQRIKGQAQPREWKYIYLDEPRIVYMLNNSGKSFSHLRTLVLIPFKKSTDKHAFLRELTHLIQNQVISKPEPYKSVLLLVITLFSEIRSDKSIIEPLQFLYEFMAQKCTNNEFLKTIIGLYHCVIEESEEVDRKLLLTILAKSMVRIMPYVENGLEILRDFQQFYQIGELVYFEMYPQQYEQIKDLLEGSDSLEEVIGKACEEEGEGLVPIVEGWLDTGFKKLVREKVEALMSEVEDTNDS